jgi:hypothetical protein
LMIGLYVSLSKRGSRKLPPHNTRNKQTKF